jgi:hypothetical protein
VASVLTSESSRDGPFKVGHGALQKKFCHFSVPSRESLVCDIPAGDRKIVNLFFTVHGILTLVVEISPLTVTNVSVEFYIREKSALFQKKSGQSSDPLLSGR